MPPKKKKSTSVSPTKKKRATDLVEKKTTCVSLAKKKKATDLVEKNKGKKKESPVKKRKQSPGKRKRDVSADQEREPEAPPLHSTPAPTENETDLAEIERDPTEPPSHSTAAVTDHETERHETERPPSTQVEQPSGSSTRSPSPELEEEDDEEIGSTNAGRPQADEDMAAEPIRPNSFFFKQEDYWKSCKLQFRCHQHKFMMMTVELLDESEKKWFLEHHQFKHLFHMVCTPTRKVMGLWMLLIRTIVTYKSRQVWFAVNGVPIHYSIREHGLISGLYCHQYPENYKSGLSMKFADKQFRKMFMKKLKNMKKKKKKKNPEEEELKVTVQDVEEKLSRMKLDRTNDRLKMAIL
ncbi:hypothetical protein N665_0053s0009 [Sinapis alba]|nr:hypothetical protein N665_0053s0009 [Sinapis alba]